MWTPLFPCLPFLAYIPRDRTRSFSLVTSFRTAFMGLFMASHNGQKWSRYFFLESRIFFSETRIFTSSREYFCRVENFFLESRFFCWVENFFIKSRIPTMPCRHLPPKWSNNMAICRSVGYVAFLYIVVIGTNFSLCFRFVTYLLSCTFFCSAVFC